MKHFLRFVIIYGVIAKTVTAQNIVSDSVILNAGSFNRSFPEENISGVSTSFLYSRKISGMHDTLPMKTGRISLPDENFAVAGALIGFGGGAIAGAAIGFTYEPSYIDFGRDFNTCVGAVVGSLTGALMGLVIGSHIEKYEYVRPEHDQSKTSL